MGPHDEHRRQRWVRPAIATAAVAATVLVVQHPTSLRTTPSGTTVVAPDPAATEAADRPDTARPFGGVSGVAVSVAPDTGLDDGDAVRIAVDGLEHLPGGAIALMCRADVLADDHPERACDVAAVHPLDGDTEDGIGPAVTAQMHVRVGRVLDLAAGPHDCATAPVGCVLVLAPYALPPRGIAVPLAFRDRPLLTPTAVLEAPTDLGDGDHVVIRAEGFRPRSSVWIIPCGPDDRCDGGTASIPVSASASGRVVAVVAARAAIYPPDGRVDCVRRDCRLRVAAIDGSRHAETASLSFAPGTVAPQPLLTLDPPGPYVDGQTVTVRGTGFPPGLEIGHRLGQCPGDRDTREDERCAYDLDPVVVAEDGTFTTSRSVHADLLFTGPCAVTGCVLGWVLNHGTTVAPVVLEVTG